MTLTPSHSEARAPRTPTRAAGGPHALIRTFVALIVAALALARPAAADDVERWYIIEMLGQRSGWAMTAQATEGDRITTTTEMRVEIRRGAVAIAVSIEGTFVETVAGKPVSFEVTQRMGAAPTSLKAVFVEDGIDVTLRGPTGAKTTRQPHPEGTWLPPAAAASYLRQRLAAGAEKIELRTLDTSSGLDPFNPAAALKPVLVTRTDLRPDTLRVMGRDAPATRCVTVSSAFPTLKSTEWLDEAGVPIKAQSLLGGIGIVMTAADKAQATARVAAPELMVSTFVKPDRLIENPQDARRAEFTLSITAGEIPTIPATGVQRVEPIDERSCRVLIDLGAPADAPAADEGNPAYLAQTGFLGGGDDRVRDLAKKAVTGSGEDSTARAEAMRRFVHRFIRRKGLDVGFAGAAEVARSAAGDCTEHAALLAGMLRADGIPSRVAAGLIYAEEFAGERGVFAYHMWTQALLEVDGRRRWVDLDATLPAPTPMDATHIALVVTGMGEGESTEVFLAIASLMGRVGVKVEAAR